MTTRNPDPKMSLDVEQPDDVAAVLEHVATIFRNNADELDAGWQDKSAGRPWRKIATILDRAALSCLKVQAWVYDSTTNPELRP